MNYRSDKREREIKFIGLFEDRGHQGPCSPYKPLNHNLSLGQAHDWRTHRHTHTYTHTHAGNDNIRRPKLASGKNDNITDVNHRKETWSDFQNFMSSHLTHCVPSDAILRQRSLRTLVQIMACCLMTSSHNLDQCWLIISKVVTITWVQFHKSHWSLTLAWKLLI